MPNRSLFASTRVYFNTWQCTTPKIAAKINKPEHSGRIFGISGKEGLQTLGSRRMGRDDDENPRMTLNEVSRDWVLISHGMECWTSRTIYDLCVHNTRTKGQDCRAMHQSIRSGSQTGVSDPTDCFTSNCPVVAIYVFFVRIPSECGR
jgi:hypothetical protein